MGRVIEGAVRTQATLLPESTDEYVGEDHPVRVVDAFVDALDLAALGMLASSPKPKVITLTSAWGGARTVVVTFSRAEYCPHFFAAV